MKATEEEDDYDPLLLESGRLEKKDREGLEHPTASTNNQASRLPKHNTAFHEQIPAQEDGAANHRVTSQQKVSFSLSHIDVVTLFFFFPLLIRPMLNCF